MKWILVQQALPPEHELVDTLTHAGTQQKLRRLGNLWFHEAGQTYVYYVPDFWARLSDNDKKGDA